MKVKPPPDRHQFANAWDEIGYLRDKLLYRLYQREDADKARPYAERLEELLPKADPDQEAILAQECWSLVSEIKGDLQKAIDHREKDVRRRNRLAHIGGGTDQRPGLGAVAHGHAGQHSQAAAPMFRARP